MRLDEFEERMLRGEMGPVRQRALEQQLQVAQFFDAEDFVEVQQAHIMADTEALGEAGVAWLERVAAADEDERRVLVPTVTDPRGADFKRFEAIRQDPVFVELERRTDRAFRALGVLMTDTCINYQTIMPPVMGEHLAMGDTGVVIASNSVFGARSNYEGGPSALAAALTGRTPRYGFHLDRYRIGTTRFHLDTRPRDLAEWGAVGGIVGREMRSYFEVPVIDGVDQAPSSDQLKHLGAAMGSYGSTAMFHMVGVTPEAHDVTTVFDGPAPRPSVIDRDRIEAFVAGYQPTSGDSRLDVVVFAAPQLSLFELEMLSQLIAGRRVHPATTVLIATSPEVKSAADRMGITAVIEDAGAIVLEGVCFYQMHARELGEANGWERLMTNSAKLANIIGGYGYDPVLAPMDRCIDCACDGRVT